jgi:hypothetical protein
MTDELDPEASGAPEAAAPTSRPTPLLYLDADDEITSVAARIRATEADHVALVLPYGSRLSTSRINFRILAREAAERGKRIEIICADPSARALATAAGLPVHPSVAAFEGHRNGVALESAPGEAGTEGGNGSVSTSAAAGAGAATAAGRGATAATIARPIEPDIEDDTATRVITLPRRSTPRVPIVGPPRPPVRTGVAIGVGLAAIVLVIAGGLLALELLPSATIVLAPRSEPVGPLSLTVNASVDVTTADPELLVIPAQRVAFSVAASETITATGLKVTETSATGNVTFSNFDTGSQNRVEAGSIVSTDSKVEFATLADVTLPPATIQFPFTIVPSTSTVGVQAVEPGEVGNVGNNTITNVPKGENRRLLQVTNLEATSGGARTEAPEISQADVDGALAALDTALAAELDRQVAEGLGVPPGVTIFPQTQAIGEAEYATDPQALVGSASLEVELSATAEGSVLGVDPSPIEVIAEARLASRVSEGWSLAPDSTSFGLGTPTVLGEVVTYPVTIGATQVHDVDQAALVDQVRGLVLAEARSRLDDFGDVEITVWPDWVTTMPTNAERITFTLDEPRPAPSPTP